MLLYIVRHGDPDYVTDTLTERGKIQAEAVANRMRDSKIDRVYSSPMGRARQTAEPTCRMLGLPCEIEEWAHEIGNECLHTPFPDGVKCAKHLLSGKRIFGAGLQPYLRLPRHSRGEHARGGCIH